MEMKAMMFAGGGLFLSMVATTIWISGDVSRMREEERAADARKCAMAAQADAQQSPGAVDTAPAGDFATPAEPQTDDACATADGAGSDPNAGAIDPATGEQLQPSSDQFTDPGSGSIDPASGAIDPATGLPVDASVANVDPVTGAPLDSGQSFDPSTGDPGISTGTDPNAMPVTGEPTTGNVAVAGF